MDLHIPYPAISFGLIFLGYTFAGLLGYLLGRWRSDVPPTDND